jgi:hypothetical protein
MPQRQDVVRRQFGHQPVGQGPDAIRLRPGVAWLVAGFARIIIGRDGCDSSRCRVGRRRLFGADRRSDVRCVRDRQFILRPDITPIDLEITVAVDTDQCPGPSDLGRIEGQRPFIKPDHHRLDLSQAPIHLSPARPRSARPPPRGRSIRPAAFRARPLRRRSAVAFHPGVGAGRSCARPHPGAAAQRRTGVAGYFVSRCKGAASRRRKIAGQPPLQRREEHLPFTLQPDHAMEQAAWASNVDRNDHPRRSATSLAPRTASSRSASGSDGPGSIAARPGLGAGTAPICSRERQAVGSRGGEPPGKAVRSADRAERVAPHLPLCARSLGEDDRPHDPAVVASRLSLAALWLGPNVRCWRPAKVPVVRSHSQTG